MMNLTEAVDFSFWSIRIIFNCGGTQGSLPEENEWFGQVWGQQPAKSTRDIQVADWDEFLHPIELSGSKYASRSPFQYRFRYSLLETEETPGVTGIPSGDHM